MANVSVKIDVKYRITGKNSAGKEITQKTIKQSLFFPEITEAQLTAMTAFVGAVTEVTELIPD